MSLSRYGISFAFWHKSDSCHNASKVTVLYLSQRSSDGTWFAGAMKRHGGDQPDHVVVGFSSAFKTGLLSNFLVFVWIAALLVSTELFVISWRICHHTM